MTASLIPVSTGSPMIFTKDEATAAQATWLFYLSNTADGSPATGKTIAGADFKISKNGAAFGNAAGAVTEVSLGWYKMVFAAADLDTLGALACELAVEAGVDPLRVVHQVVALDLNTATVNPGANGITAATIAGDVATELNAGMATAAAVAAITLATRTITKDLGSVTDTAGNGADNDDGDLVATSTLDTLDVTFQVSGTWGGATATIQVTQDAAATVPVWTDYVDALTDNPLTADGEVIVAGGGHVAARVNFTGTSGSTDLAITAVIRKPANT
jgi:hypothetical protein